MVVVEVIECVLSFLLQVQLFVSRVSCVQHLNVNWQRGREISLHSV